ncbi:MAG: aromatic amino acid lyase, partial [Mesorhizobium sp.]
MPVSLSTREDINLDTVLRVAWKKDTVAIGEKALQRIAECRASFLKLIETNPPPVIYGVTTAMG